MFPSSSEHSLYSATFTGSALLDAENLNLGFQNTLTEIYTHLLFNKVPQTLYSKQLSFVELLQM